MASEIACRELSSFSEHAECVEIQRETWGPESRDHVPASLMSVAVKVGGVAAGAFRGPEGPMVGFVFGLAGWREGEPVHWSHMLAVRRDHRGRGIGRRLKGFQRKLLLEAGVETVFWTYDPLVARNAHLNLNLLGARVDDFVVDMYGTEARSPLHVGGATDRFVVRWELDTPRVRRALAGRPEGPEGPVPGDAPTLEPRDVAEAGELPDVDVLRLALPARAVALGNGRGGDRGRAWREGLRAALLHYLGRGYRVAGFIAEPDREGGHYVLRRG